MPRTGLFTRLRTALRTADHLERHGLPLDLALEQREAWSRRRFLKTTAAAAAVAPLTFGRAAYGAEPPRVVILGAGAAGLTCAYRLQQSGISATIYEAAPRVGGRMYSLQNYFPDGQVAELGGELIDTDHHAIRNLARELGLELIDLTYLDHSNGHDYYIDGRLYETDADWIEAFQPVADAVRRDIGENNENCDVSWNSGTARGKALDAMSIAEWLDRNEIGGSIRKVIEAAYVGEYGLQLEEQSALNLLCAVGTTPDTFGIFGESNERYRTKGGNGMIPVRLAQELERGVELGSAVEAIRDHNGAYKLTIRRGKSKPVDVIADVVITTIPLTVMRNLDLSKLTLTRVQRDTIRHQGYGTNSKMMVGLNARPWVQMNVTAYTFTDLPFQACWDTSRGQSGQHAILTNFTGGKQGLAIGKGTLQDRAREFVAQAEQVFPGTAAAYTGKAVRQIWPEYEWSLGSYSCPRPGDYQRYFGALEQPQGRFIFAGEHTMAESGFMNSAVESGERAATHVLASLNVRQRAA
ncbi:MAG TPA: NAD(P)/FAD-dependent oxidoreductase [Thermoanaerobaculia bacterium]|jgi:monoamine oxidase